LEKVPDKQGMATELLPAQKKPAGQIDGAVIDGEAHREPAGQGVQAPLE